MIARASTSNDCFLFSSLPRRWPEILGLFEQAPHGRSAGSQRYEEYELQKSQFLPAQPPIPSPLSKIPPNLLGG